jgi:Ca2+-transporting ATPase
LILILMLYVPALRDMFHFSALHLEDLVIVFAAGILSVVWFKLLNVRLE